MDDDGVITGDGADNYLVGGSGELLNPAEVLDKVRARGSLAALDLEDRELRSGLSPS